MTKISNLYSLTNYITANTSGNIVISAPSSGYALDVTGTGRFTGAVTAANFYVPSSNEIRLYNTNSTNWGTIKGSTDSANGYITLTGGSGNGMTIANSGNVGIGTSSPSQKLDIYGRTRISNPSNSAQFLEVYTDGGSVYYNAQNNSIQNTAYQHIFFTDGASPVERMRITSGGSLVMGATSITKSGIIELNGNTTNYNLISLKDTGTASSGVYFIAFWNSGDALCGGVQHNTTSTVSYYTGPSDARLKSNIKDVDYSVLPLFANAKLKTYNHIADEDESIVYKGFLAQEMVDNFPEAYGQDKEGFYMYNPNGYIPYLVQAIQELSAKVTALENK